MLKILYQIYFFMTSYKYVDCKWCITFFIIYNCNDHNFVKKKVNIVNKLL